MISALDQFKRNIVNVRSIGGVFEAVAKLTTPAVVADDLLRAEIVMAVSALDHFVHELTLSGMLEIYGGTRPSTPAYKKYQVSIGDAVPGVMGGTPDWFETSIRNRHSFLTFQQPDKIADAIRLFSTSELWPSVATAMGKPPSDVKSQLRLVVDRRNKIAHESDIDPSYPGVQWPISASVATTVVDFIDEVCHAIYNATL